MSGSMPDRAMSAFERFAYSVGNLGVGLLPSIVGSWAMYYFAPPPEEGSCLMSYVPIYLIGIMLGIGRVAEALLNPFIGHWSDKIRTKRGRRIPFILYGTPVMVIGLIALWFPPVMSESLINAAWVCFWMIIISCAFASVVAPYLALLPELTPHNDERLTVSAFMALFEVLGLLIAAAGAGMLIEQFKCGVGPFGAQEFNGFQLAAIILGILTLAAFYITAFGVRERQLKHSDSKPMPFFEGAKAVFRNPAFSPYLALATFFRIGMDMVVVVIPYMATVVMGGSESDAVAAQLIVLVGAVLLFPLVNGMSVRYGKKLVTVCGSMGFVVILPLMFLIGKIPGLEPMTQGYIVFALATFPVAVFNVLPRPMLADVIDYDEKLTGLRREAIYNGMEGLFSRSGSGLAWVLTSLVFFAFGNSSENPLGILLVGPIGGALVLIGTLWFLRYPFKK